MKRLSSCLLVFFLVGSSVYAMPSFEEVKKTYRKSDAVLLDRHGRVIHELRVDPGGRRLDWVKIGNVSPALIKTVIRSEDKRFYGHHGVDWTAVGAAAIRNLFAGKTRGASTITMQLVSLTDKRLRPKGGKRTLGQKWDQIRAAEELEKTWRKDEILEAYLNLITFRGELQGIEAASRGLFGKEPDGLDERESLVLAALIRSPNSAVRDVQKRACLLAATEGTGVRCEEIMALANKALSGPYAMRQKFSLAPHVAYLLLGGPGRRERSSLRQGKRVSALVSTIDGDLQSFAADALSHHLSAVRSQNVNDGAVLVVENRTGDILAYVGGAGEESSARYVDGIRARRQAGSTLKPFLYALAFDREILTPASLLNDSPIDVPTPLGIYRPEDYESDFKGVVSARAALASSLNVPAVRTVALTGVESFVTTLKRLGFSGVKSPDYYGPSIALGSLDVSLFELVNAYRALANGGIRGEMRLTPDKKAKSRVRVFSQRAAFLVSDVLSDRVARSVTFSLENPLSTKFWSAVKTGTSKDMRDNWCIGYTRKYTVGVWVGNSGGSPMWNVSGVTGAAPVWLEVMNYLSQNERSFPITPPEGLVARKVSFGDEIEGERSEWFIGNTAPGISGGETARISSNGNVAVQRILYPSEGAIIALDPDIPADRQRLFFEAAPRAEDTVWLLNGKEIGRSSEQVFWVPVAGDYELSLVGPKDRVIDSVSFTVKGE